ncbi:DUF4326 domain-containing protein [Microseira sp. BLCC-F43]|uniref:DUF4326 domain-containing protein n=1 Tax=Microseira sp. BLCC-F43 TaxID=3153602 RepID=UPI0035BC7DBF
MKILVMKKTGSISVANGKKIGFIASDAIYVGRKHVGYRLSQSPLANPYVIGKDGSRSEVIELYRKWLWQQIKSWQEEGTVNPVVGELLAIRDRLNKGKHLVLTCWCHPLPCHADVIVRCVKWIMEKER